MTDFDDHRDFIGAHRAVLGVLGGGALDVLEPAEPRDARQLLRLGVAADDRDGADEDAAVLLDELTRQFERASGGEQVVDADDALVLEKPTVLGLGREEGGAGLVRSFSLFHDLAPDRPDSRNPEARVVGERLPDGPRTDDDVRLQFFDPARDLAADSRHEVGVV